MLLAALQFVEWSRSLGRKLRFLGFFFSFYFLLLKITVREHQNEQKDVWFLSGFVFPLSFKYLLHTRGKEKTKIELKWLSKLRVNVEQNRNPRGGWRSCRRGTDRKRRRLNRAGGAGQREAARGSDPSSGGFRKGTFQQPCTYFFHGFSCLRFPCCQCCQCLRICRLLGSCLLPRLLVTTAQHPIFHNSPNSSKPILNAMFNSKGTKDNIE